MAPLQVSTLRSALSEASDSDIKSASFVGKILYIPQNYMAGASGPPANTYNSVESGYNPYPTQNTMYSTPQPNTGHIGHSTGGNYNGAGYGSQYNSNYGY